MSEDRAEVTEVADLVQRLRGAANWLAADGCGEYSILCSDAANRIDGQQRDLIVARADLDMANKLFRAAIKREERADDRAKKAEAECAALRATYASERAKLVAEVGECCNGGDPFCAEGCLVQKALRVRAGAIAKDAP